MFDPLRGRLTTTLALAVSGAACLAAAPPRPTAPPAVPEPAPFVWADTTGEGRAQVVLFRTEVRVPPARAGASTAVQSAVLHLFADSRYLLFVNGHAVNFGPARFYPAHPEYDSHDLAPLLRAGRNVIGVKVMNFGTQSFQLRRNPGAFSAWGHVTAGGKIHDLRTPGAWKAIRDPGYDATAPRMSFATSPIEVYDARRGRADFLDPEASLGDWRTPVAVARRELWGPLSLRTIPLLTQEVVTPRALTGAFTLAGDEELFSFRVKVPDGNRQEYGHPYTLLATTQIHSPRDQDVTLGLWWGDHYLNGEGPLKHEGLAPGARARRIFRVHLRAGWNPFFVRYGAIWGTWDFSLAVPKAAGVTLSPGKSLHGGPVFLTAGPFTPDEEKQLKTMPMPLVSEGLPAGFSAAWRPHAREDRAANPALNIAWSRPAASLPIDPARTFDIDIPPGPDAGLVFDLGGKQLGRVFIEYEAPAGTAVDLGFSEDLEDGRPTLLRRAGLYTATRHVSAGGIARFETIKPYGLRFLQANVTNHRTGARIRRIGVVRQVYPFVKTGSFVSSDPLLNALWETGWRTLQVCAEDSYVDTPFRERGLYAGDMLPEMAITLATSGDLRLVKRSLRLFQEMYIELFVPNATRHPDEIGLLDDFPFITLESWKWYVDRTGDREFARELYPAYRHLVDGALARRDRDGLVEMPNVFIEWSSIEKRDVKSTAFQALLARASRSLSGIARLLGDEAAAARYQRAAEEVATALRTHLWNEPLGAFRDGKKGGQLLDSQLPISSAWVSLWGLTAPAHEQRLADFWARELADIGSGVRTMRATSYGGFFVLGALYRNGHARIAEDFMRKHWGPMISQLDDTVWEDFAGGSDGTLSHAWSGGPTFYLTTQTLGVNLGYPEPSDPDQVVIAPQADTLEWARGTVPHPRGVINVAWRVQGDLLRVDVAVPQGVRYQVAPRGRLAKLRLVVNAAR